MSGRGATPASFVSLASSVVLPHVPGAVVTVRDMVGDVLLGRDVSRMAREGALAVVHELVCNAVDHGTASAEGTFTVTWQVRGDELVLSVRDAGQGGAVAVQPLDLTGARGRGLRMVDGLSSRWEVTRDEGTLVTAWLALV